MKKSIKLDMVCRCGPYRREERNEKLRAFLDKHYMWDKTTWVSQCLYLLDQDFSARLIYSIDMYVSIQVESPKFIIKITADKLEDALIEVFEYLEEYPELERI